MPDFMVMFITPPPRPISGLKLLVSNVNSWIASMGGMMAIRPWLI